MEIHHLESWKVRLASFPAEVEENEHLKLRVLSRDGIKGIGERNSESYSTLARGRGEGTEVGTICLLASIVDYKSKAEQSNIKVDVFPDSQYG
jgi:hypothetical protein